MDCWCPRAVTNTYGHLKATNFCGSNDVPSDIPQRFDRTDGPQGGLLTHEPPKKTALLSFILAV